MEHSTTHTALHATRNTHTTLSKVKGHTPPSFYLREKNVTIVFASDIVFMDKLPFCTEPGCAYTPQSDVEEYRGLVKPGIEIY